MTDLSNTRSHSETLVLAEHLGVYAATQPCSGTKVVASHAFSPGTGTASPQIVGSTKKSAA